nr:uncharacterized protein LOC112546114 isoform X3 [Pelodiscus sinensis]XP_025041406.1 uncharacterized protein LOC112546114 isoform X3 [Pelodiscus sinensis]|eukprot:XP_025041404.1 uncharacterized protein LOC112546114 isoform X3 [Pelodiscus sinensis]
MSSWKPIRVTQNNYSKSSNENGRKRSRLISGFPYLFNTKIKIAEAQLKAKEFSQLSKYRPPVMCKEYPVSQGKEIAEGLCSQAPVSSDDKLEKGHKGGSFGPESFREVQEEQRKYFNTVLPNANQYLSKCYPHPEQAATQVDKTERTQLSIMPQGEPAASSPLFFQPPEATEQCPGTEGQEGPVSNKRRPRQTWDNYQQFIRETCRARQAKAQQNRSLVLGSSVFREDCCSSDGTSTYSTDYKYWSGVHKEHCKAHKNFSKIVFEDGSLNESPWVSEYKDSYSIFLQKLNWPSPSAMSALCSAVKPITHLSHGLASHQPIPVNAVF